MCDKQTQFSNPHELPVEKLLLTVTNAGVVQQINALDAYWVEKRALMLYERPPGAAPLPGALEAWRAGAEAYADDVKWLLGLEHYRFWSTVVHHPQCMDMLVSFLQEASPPYLPPLQCRASRRLYEDVRRLVFVAFSRLITNKESKSQWMSKEYLRDLIYDKFIFTVPILWDLCLVYGADNTQHVARLLASVFTLQPRYQADLDAAIAFVKEALKYIILQVNKDYDSVEPPNLPESFQGFGDIRRPGVCAKDEKLTLDSLRDLVVHLLDTTLTMRIFVECYPNCVDVLRKRGFVLSIVQLYEHAIPQLYERLEELGDDPGDFPAVRGLIDAARAELVDVFREILDVAKNAIFSDEAHLESHVEAYLSLMMEGLSERLLIRDYHACCPVGDDLDMLRQAYPSIHRDPVKTDFILQAIYSNLDEPLPEPSTDHLTNGHAISSHADLPPPTKDPDIPDGIRQESLISEVKDIFPDLGDGFVLKCLEHFGMNSETVIGCILEDNLPGSLRSLDRNLPVIPDDVVDQKFLETGIERLNVFDGDEFDIMTRDDVDLTKMHKGKRKGKYRDLKDMLNDKSDVKKMVDIYSKYNMVCDETDMYSDEYDDTYDAEGGPAPPARAAPPDDDLGRPFVTPRALAPRHRYEEESEDEPEPAPAPDRAGGSGGGDRNRMDFCQNPEEVRARREAAYRARGGRGGHRPPPERNTDVAGKPRGQGQDKEVLHNREKKEKNKSSRGNHSRRSGAQWKRSQGMMPS